jgi:hypothetical protein
MKKFLASIEHALKSWCQSNELIHLDPLSSGKKKKPRFTTASQQLIQEITLKLQPECLRQTQITISSGCKTVLNDEFTNRKVLKASRMHLSFSFLPEQNRKLVLQAVIQIDL